MITNTSRSQQCLCATGIFLLVYSLAGIIVGYYFLSYYQQQIDITTNIDPEKQPCSNLCGYYTRQKSKNYCCDFYGAGCKTKQVCQKQRQSEYQMQVTIYEVVLGISLGYMGLYICYQIYKFVSARLSPRLHIPENLGISVTVFQSDEVGNGAYNRFKTQSQRNTENTLKNIDNHIVCSICLEREGKKYVELICGHRFHEECIRNWIAVKKTCPVCRRQVGKPSFSEF